MGNRNSGRKPAPTAIKLLRGVGAHRLNPDEARMPRAPDSFDTPPEELAGDRVALAEWGRVVPLLRRIGLVSLAERGALIALCQVWSQYCAAQGQIRREGMVLETERGSVVNPLIGIQDKALKHLQRLWGDLGLTPSGRSRLAALPAGDPAAKPTKWAGIL